MGQMAKAQHRVIDATKMRQNFADITNRVTYGGERLVIEKHGKAAVAMISLEDLELLEKLEDARDLRRVREAMKESRTTAWADFKAKRGL
jgi:prevent-host-death family protein